MTSGTMSPAELMAGLRDDTKALLAAVKAERVAADKALAAMRAEMAKVVARQNAYDTQLEGQSKKVAGALSGLDRKIEEATRTIDLKGEAEQAAARMAEPIAAGHRLADRLEEVAKDVWVLVGYAAVIVLGLAVIFAGIGLTVWSVSTGWEVAVTSQASVFKRIFGGLAVLLAVGLAGWALWLGVPKVFGKLQDLARPRQR